MPGLATLAGLERGKRFIRQDLFPGGRGKALILSQTSGVFQAKPDEQGWAFGLDFRNGKLRDEGGFALHVDEMVVYGPWINRYNAATMFSIQKLFAKDDKFFELLEASAEESRASVQALKQVLKGGKALDDFAAARQKEKQITVQISELLARTSVTVLDREDIEAISSVLYKIPKTVEKFAERYLISTAQLREVDFSRQVLLLERATDTVVVMIRELEKSHFEQVNHHNEELQEAEGEADDLMIQLLKELYSGRYPPVTVVIVKDLYELLEKVVDRCRDVGNVVANVVLKHS